MPNLPVPGPDTGGFRDGAGHRLLAFADTTARDTWVTSIGGTAALVAGVQVFITGSKMINVWDGAAWRTSVALT